MYLEIRVNGVEHLGVLGQLCSNVVRANKDALQVGPGPLHLEPDGDDRVGCGQLLLPVRHLLQEVAHKLRSHHVLKLDLYVRERGDISDYCHIFVTFGEIDSLTECNSCSYATLILRNKHYLISILEAFLCFVGHPMFERR